MQKPGPAKSAERKMIMNKPMHQAQQALFYRADWHGTTLEPGMFFGIDEKGFFTTWGTLRPKGTEKVILVKRFRRGEWRVFEEPYARCRPTELMKLLWKCASDLQRRNAFIKPDFARASDHPNFKRMDVQMRDCIRIHKSSGGVPAYRLNSCNL